MVQDIDEEDDVYSVVRERKGGAIEQPHGDERFLPAKDVQAGETGVRTELADRGREPAVAAADIDHG